MCVEKVVSVSATKPAPGFWRFLHHRAVLKQLSSFPSSAATFSAVFPAGKTTALETLWTPLKECLATTPASLLALSVSPEIFARKPTV